MENDIIKMKVISSDLSKLETLANLAGFEVSIDNPSVENGQVIQNVVITYNSSELYTKQKRGAGRKQLDIGGTLEDIKKEIAETSMKEVAERRGVSRRTLQRRIKNATDAGDKYI